MDQGFSEISLEFADADDGTSFDFDEDTAQSVYSVDAPDGDPQGGVQLAGRAIAPGSFLLGGQAENLNLFL